MDNNTEAPIKPAQWTWIVQRAETDGKAASIWKFGFVAPDGAEVRVTFHQVAEPKNRPVPQPDPMTGMPPQIVTPPGQPDTAKTEDGVFYITYFTNRHPEHFMKWDVSLSHEDSMSSWVTITHGIVDFIRKAKPQNVVLDDLANGKLKMVLRSVSMDVAAANPDYELETIQKHVYRGFYQIKKKGSKSAFQTSVDDSSKGETEMPSDGSPITGPDKGQSKDAPPSNGVTDGASADPAPQTPPEAQQPPVAPLVAKQMPSKRGLSVEIGKDYSVTVRDASGLPVDRYRGKNPADILRWLNAKGFASAKMKVVDSSQPTTPESLPIKGVIPTNQSNMKEEMFTVHENRIRVPLVTAKQAALMNYTINANVVRCTVEHVEFEFESAKDMAFKRALVEIAFRQLG